MRSTNRKRHQICWRVTRGSAAMGTWREIDRVFFNDDVSVEEVRESLINHDGYPSDIRVTRVQGGAS